MRILMIFNEKILSEYDGKRKPEHIDSLLEYLTSLTVKHQIWIACDAAFPEAVMFLRRYLHGILPSMSIVTYHLPFSQREGDKNSSSKQQIRDYIFSYFSKQFSPQLLLTVVLREDDASLCRIDYARSSRFPKNTYLDKAQKPTLAYFSPIAPAKSGISSYSDELLPYLSQYYDITLIVAQEDADPLHGAITFPLLSPEDFVKKAERFDRILYHFGNSFYHSYMWSLLMQYPGTVVLHDFFLSGLLSYEELSNGKALFWTEQLFKSHGYKALKARFTEGESEVAHNFPCNFEVLQHAQGIIVHSEYSKVLAQQWYTLSPFAPWTTIPHLRVPTEEYDKSKIREALGFKKDDLLICSFGLLNSTKLNHKLLHAFLDSSLAKDPNVYLVYVGEFTCQEYARELRNTINASEEKERIRITGWTDNTTFHHYLQAADIGVQLRAESRGETSGTVLDCMNYGLATIVNANGSMASLPSDSVYMLDDNFDDAALVKALEALKSDNAFRKQLGEEAKHCIRTGHSPEKCAYSYAESIEASYMQQNEYHTMLRSIASLDVLSSQPKALNSVAEPISCNILPKVVQKQLLVDVSAVVQHDLRTGIQRVVRAQLLELINLAPDNVRVEPVYLSGENGFTYRYARAFASEILDIPLLVAEGPVKVHNGDIFYGLDFHWDGVIKAAKEDIYTRWAAEGVSISFAVYDLLPIRYPEFFPDDSARLHTEWLKAILPVSATLITISEAVANALKSWTSEHLPQELERGVSFAAVHLGSDIIASAPSEGLPENAKETLDAIGMAPAFLMVGTIEPRKGYLQTLAAFELLWEKGSDVHLVIVGKEGWVGLPAAQRKTIPDIIHKLETHPQLGKKLFWLKETSDAFLEALYRQADALIAASEDEGFGLPLIEAAHYALPIIARDIPVFNEVASTHAYYFPNSRDPLELAEALSKWLESHSEGKHIRSAEMAHISWEESARRVLEVLLPQEEHIKASTQNSKRSDTAVFQKEEVLPMRARQIYQELMENSGEEKS